MSAAATPDVSLYSFDVNVQAFIISTTNNIYVYGGGVAFTIISSSHGVGKIFFWVCG